MVGQCPLYPRKRTFAHAIRMSALGHKQTSRLIRDESVYPSLSDIGRRWSHGGAIIACRADWQFEFKTGAMRVCL
jgi:hypothetical protein